jgi:hypothetical protein
VTAPAVTVAAVAVAVRADPSCTVPRARIALDPAQLSAHAADPSIAGS